MERIPISCIRLRVKLSLLPVVRQAVVQESMGFCHWSTAEFPGLGKIVDQDLPVLN